MSDDSRFDDIELAEAVQAIRTGLTSAATAGEGQDLAFDVGEITMEFTVEMRKDVRGSGRVRAWVVNAGAEGSRGSTHTHKVTFTLLPRDNRTGASWRVGNERPGRVTRFGAVEE
ncbi:trypco2 family protein [Streptomyces orinoci]|uniref:Trypco2 family protein n=1 Tax=Streptomyces orinoci TaxID=67339 RepID=A0ABV3JYK5_STRON|nr:trypco2 family protein [Streptomyces orinoci]